MDIEKTSKLICEKRKSKNMTQRDLAEQLGVTDKAVSKWERGLSCPDISLLTPLSEILDITVSELLNGEVAEHKPEIEEVVKTTLKYADNSSKSKIKSIRKWSTRILLITSLLGIMVCTICDFAISGKLTWSLYCISSIVFGLLILTPIISLERKGILIALILLSILIIPFIFTLDRIIFNLDRIIGVSDLLMPIGARASAVSIVYLWAVYILFTKIKDKFISAGISVLLAVPVTFLINYVVDKFVLGIFNFDIWDIVSCAATLVIAAVFIGIRYIRNNRAVD